MINEGTTKDRKGPSQITSGLMIRKKVKELTSALQAFILSFFTGNGLRDAQGAVGTIKKSYEDDGQAWCSILECPD